MTPMQKVDVIDKYRGQVRLKLLQFLGDFPEDMAFWEEVLVVAKGRHILGHYEYGDTNLFEWSDGKVRAAIIEELADAVVYQAWLEERAANG